MALTANRDLDHYIDQELRSLPVAAGTHVFKGAFVGVTSSGHARPLTAGDAFGGIAYEEVDNTGGGNGDATVRMFVLGDFGHPLAGVTADDLGRPVFASADDTLTFTGGSNSYVGTVHDVPAPGEVVARIDVLGSRLKTLTHFVENLGAGADISLRSIGAFPSDTWLARARIVNQNVLAAGIDDTNTCVVTIQSGGGQVVSKTFDSGNPFPGANAMIDMGPLSNEHLAAGDVLSLAVTNGASANPGPFLVEIDYV